MSKRSCEPSRSSKAKKTRNEAGDESSKLLTCSVCSIVVEDLKSRFSCRTCQISLEDYEKNSSNDVNLTCEVCIQSHVRQKHDVLDYKLMKVVVCKVHLLTCSDFCRSCDKLICNICFKDHAYKKHEIISIESRATEIKKTLHEKLAQNDKEYKPLAREASDFKLKSKEFVDFAGTLCADNLRNNLQKIFRTVSEKADDINRCCEQISESNESLKSVIENFNRNISRIDDSQRNIRGFLGLSDSCLVDEYSRDKIYVKLIENAAAETSLKLAEEFKGKKELLDKEVKKSFQHLIENYCDDLSSLTYFVENDDYELFDDKRSSSDSFENSSENDGHSSVENDDDYVEEEFFEDEEASPASNLSEHDVQSPVSRAPNRSDLLTLLSRPNPRLNLTADLRCLPFIDKMFDGDE